MKKKNTDPVENLDTYNFEDDGFNEGGIIEGKVISTFNFISEDAKEVKSEVLESQLTSAKPVAFSSASSLNFLNSQRGLTPAVDGEFYTIKRCYQFRKSTVRKLNEIRAKHPDVNVYLNTIIDEAILYYYDHLFK